MKKKLLVIFFLLCIVLIIIYKCCNNKKINVLILGDSHLLKSELNYLDNFDDKYRVNTFLYDNITYKELIKNIKNNDKKVIKNKNIYLNQIISKANLIIINANNSEYFNKCKRTNNVINNYNEIINENINNLLGIINRISASKVVIIGNYCKNKRIEQKNNIEKYINVYNIKNSSILYNKIIELYN